MPQQQTIHTAHEDRQRRMAIGAARRDRADSAAYHAAASNGTNADGSLSYPAAGSAWDAIGLARLAMMGLSVAVKSYRTARLTDDQWSECHAALVAAALAKGAAPIDCAADGCGERARTLTPAPTTDGSGYPACPVHTPPLKRTVAVPARESVGVGYWQATASEDADGNLVTDREYIAPRITLPAGSVTVPLARRIDTDRMPTVGEVNGSWAIERAKGMLADLWAGATIPTPWDTDSGDDAEDGSDDAAAAVYGSAVTWEDIAPHLGADSPAERMLLDAALTGVTLSEAGTKATVYGSAKPMAHPAARKAASRAAKALSERHTAESVRAAVLAALEDSEAAEVATGDAPTTLAPMTMRNPCQPAWEARLDLPGIANGRALKSAWLARHVWPMRPTVPTPGMATRRVLALPVLLSPGHAARLPVWEDMRGERARAAAARERTATRQRAARDTAAERIAADPMAHYAAAWQRADDAAAAAAEFDHATDMLSAGRAKAARKRAADMRRHAERVTTLPVMRATRTPGWTAAERTAYLSTLPTHTPLTVPTVPTTPAATTEADSARRMQAARERAAILRVALDGPDAPSTSAYAGSPGSDVAPWRMQGACGPLTTRPLTTAEAKREAAAKRQHAARIEALPAADRKDWQGRSDAQIERAARRAKRAALKRTA